MSRRPGDRDHLCGFFVATLGRGGCTPLLDSTLDPYPGDTVHDPHQWRCSFFFSFLDSSSHSLTTMPSTKPRELTTQLQLFGAD
jgi:hypothetical protein